MKVHVRSIEVLPEDNHVVNLLVLADIEGYPFNPHRIYLPHGALETRRLIYGLDTHEEAIDALLREHGFRLSGVLDDVPTLEPEGEDRHHQFGGVHRSVRVTHTPTAEKERAAALKKLAPHLAQFRAARGIPENAVDS